MTQIGKIGITRQCGVCGRTLLLGEQVEEFTNGVRRVSVWLGVTPNILAMLRRAAQTPAASSRASSRSLTLPSMMDVAR